ncbi:DOT1-domain-containing protein [Gloeophyllum trabeum ATCC 11539]|uniref:Histone-lysine N-methyltransferase, H3 lysine-79 specific n=1 Tax=Gloeophyllum trabeum (strain ATCC 11539 / FP-39264 / Madison 617) TaxID=670483 RepID=S7QNR0_GLOTA|nr:DOT1-domain-containing protein [Gloeophyllum trabeum ATCC 11539]EPQ61196.1 DOT1-domain-containing protein [Gloeophyllum trabeum ATCC 11539]
MKGYKAYFRNPDDPKDASFDPHPTDYPSVELEYPNSNASERFILLAPKDKDHYNPIMCLEKTLHVIVEHYLSPEQRVLVGPIPTDNIADVTPPSSPLLSAFPSPAHSTTSTLTSLSSSSSSSLGSTLTSLSSLSDSPPPPGGYLRAVQRAIHRQDGPAFLKAMAHINDLFGSFKYPPLSPDPFDDAPPNPLKEVVKTWTPGGVPRKVMMRIMDECYQRCVGPHVQSLRQYTAFSSEVYGELMPSLVAEIVCATGLKPESLFMDLGSGVGSIAMQASLQSGCRSYGIEVMPKPAKIAREQLEQFKIRCRMWGVSAGEVELEEGDMLRSARVDALMKEADVVLVNNKVFEESLNEALRPKFLDLKEGAIVVSLKEFAPVDSRVTERNVDDMSTIFKVYAMKYHSGSVSWGSGGGQYYIHRVDREGYAELVKSFHTSRSSSRPARSRR